MSMSVHTSVYFLNHWTDLYMKSFIKVKKIEAK
jgi:hypothetical protein